MLDISQNRSIKDLQQDFNRQYPYLKVEFYKPDSNHKGSSKRLQLIHSLSIKNAGLMKSGKIEISDTMTVGQLEDIFRSDFGLCVQVSRKSGILWLETTMTENWTLKQQNDHGRELSEPVSQRMAMNGPPY